MSRKINLEALDELRKKHCKNHEKHHHHHHHHRKPCKKHNLKVVKEIITSDIPLGSAIVDPNLLNAWGIINIGGVLWVAANGNGTVNSYDLTGNPLPTVVQVLAAPGVPAAPDGLVANNTAGFQITNGIITAPALWIVATEDGTISAYNPLVNLTNIILPIINNSASGTVYKGITIAGSLLYAVDFHNNKVDVFDSNFNQLSGFPFIDGDPINPIPSNFAPFNIATINNLLYVTYAKQLPPDNHDDERGPGNGFVDIYTQAGIFVRRLVTRGVLNSPWGLILAPHRLELPPNSILVGNFGDGRINAFDNDGHFLGALTDCFPHPTSYSKLMGHIGCRICTSK